MVYPTKFTTAIDAALASEKIIDAEFIKLYVPGASYAGGPTYYFSTSFKNETITDPDMIDGVTTGTSVAYTPLGGLVSISGHQRDLSVTSFDTVVTLVGIDPTKIGFVLEVGNNPNNTQHGGLKGSKIQIYRGFYDSNYNLIDTPQLRYTGVVTSYTLTEDRQDKIDAFTIALHCSSYKTILENRTAGRVTNQSSWQNFAPTDVSMNRVAGLSKTTFPFGVKLA
jgi:hypothetical protein